jgi:KDO2-lipid IV(A) lauroyltransferase
MIAHRNLLKDAGRILFWFPLRWCVNLIPFSGIYWLGGLLGNIDYFFSGPRRIQKMATNISRVFELSDSELQKIIRSNLQNHIRDVLELMKYPQLTRKHISRLIFFEGLELLNDELSKKKGVLLITAHFGAKQMLQVGLGCYGYKVNQIAFHLPAEDLSFIQRSVSQRMRKSIEEKIPATFIPADGFLRSAYNCLKNGEILIVAADGVGLAKYITKGYKTFQFLGQKMFFPQNVVALAKSTGSSIIPAFVMRRGAKHHIIIEPPIRLGELNDNEVFQQFVCMLEKYVRTYPQLWEFWEEFEQGNLIAVPDTPSLI